MTLHNILQIGMVCHPQGTWLPARHFSHANLLPEVIAICAHHIDSNIIHIEYLCGYCRCLRENILRFHAVQTLDDAIKPPDTVIGIDNLTIELVLYRQIFLVNFPQKILAFTGLTLLPLHRFPFKAPGIRKITGQGCREQIGRKMQDIFRYIDKGNQFSPTRQRSRNKDNN